MSKGKRLSNVHGECLENLESGLEERILWKSDPVQRPVRGNTITCTRVSSNTLRCSIQTSHMRSSTSRNIQYHS